MRGFGTLTLALAAVAAALFTSEARADTMDPALNRFVLVDAVGNAGADAPEADPQRESDDERDAEACGQSDVRRARPPFSAPIHERILSGGLAAIMNDMKAMKNSFMSFMVKALFVSRTSE